MTRRSALVAVLALAACAPAVPDSGVGFQDYNSYVRNAGPSTGGGSTASAPAGGFNPSAAAAAIDRADGRVPGAAAAPAPVAVSGDRPRGNAPAGIKEESGEMIHAGISDENDFKAVSARETIESDKERIARNRSQYVVVQPKDLPARPGDTGPNIVAFALATTHNPGTQMYSRSGLRGNSASACARYASPDKAQQDFLSKGGPEKDRAGFDPDGDGFACDWDPRPFRTALQ